MFCIPISDASYRRAAKIARVKVNHLAPVRGEDFENKSVEVDAVLLRATNLGMESLERIAAQARKSSKPRITSRPVGSERAARATKAA